MNIDRQSLHRHSAFALLLLLGLCISGPASAQFTMTINSLADDGLQVPDDMICVTAASECTFRAAIEAANNRSDIVIIEFSPDLDTDALGRSIITPQSPLPTITQTVIIQGQTHPEFNPSQNLPRFLISGAAAGSSANGLRFEGGSENSQVRHLAVHDFMLSGIILAAVDSITLQDNYIGLRPLSLGTSEPAGNSGSGIVVTGSSNNLIEDNWIGGNGGDGIFIASGSADNLIVRNRIGQRSTGGGIGVDLAGNLGNGVHVAASAGSGNRIGLCSGFPQESCQANVITANGGHGVALLADDQQVQANWIGATPEAPDDPDYGNGDHGIRVDSSDNSIIGGLIFRQTIRHNTAVGISLAAGGNVVSGNLIRGNGARGIDIIDGGQDIMQNIIGEHEWGIGFSHSPDGTPGGLVRILGNRIGVSDNDDPIPNSIGIVGWEAGFSRIGEAGQGNIIAFNTSGGIAFNEAEASTIQSNWIGILPDGTPAGNDGPGIHVTVLSEGGSGGTKRIGYLAQDAIPEDHVEAPGALGNIIAHNGDGVLIDSNQDNFNLNDNPVRGNRFFANQGQAINLGADGDIVDPGGAQEGPNRLQNFPVFETSETFFDEGSGGIEFTYTVNTTSGNASYPLRVDFYVADGSSSQGRVFLHTDEYTGAFAAQPRSGSFTPPPGIDLQSAYLVATATDASGNTSQFSAAIPLVELGDEIFQDRFEEAEK
jgi:trimeric autotransporter adhesin